MSKNIKLIRAIFLVALCAMMVLSILDTHEIRRNTDFDQENILTHIENLTANGPRSIFDMEENQLAVKYITDTLDSWGLVHQDTTDGPAYMVHSYVGPESRYQNFYLDNVIVHIPANAAEPTGEAFMFMAHTDSVPMGNGQSCLYSRKAPLTVNAWRRCTPARSSTILRTWWGRRWRSTA